MEMEMELVEMATEETTGNEFSLDLGQEFFTFSDFQNFLNARSKAFGEKWSIGTGGRTVHSANSKISNPSLHYKEEFKYAFVHFKCIHGGLHKSKASKRNRRSLQLECPARITLSARRNVDKMVITKLVLEHNHELVAESCGYYPADRKPTEEEKGEIIRLKTLGMSSGKIVVHMSETSNKVFRRYDIHNVLATVSQEKKKALNEEAQKREKMSKLWDDIVATMMSSNQESFDRRYQVLRSVVDSWNKGLDIPSGMVVGKQQPIGKQPTGKQQIETVIRKIETVSPSPSHDHGYTVTVRGLVKR